MFSVSNDQPTNSGVSEEASQTDLQPAPKTDRSLVAEASEHTSAAPPTPDEIHNLSAMYEQPAVSSDRAPAASSSQAPADVPGRTPGFRRTETQALDQFDAKGELDEKMQAKLLNKVSKPQSNDRGRKIAELTEQEHSRLTGGMSEKDKKSVAQALKDYTSDSTSINNVLRGNDEGSAAGTKGRKTAADNAVAAVNKLQETQGDVSRVTYRLQSYKGDDKARMPFGSNIIEGDTVQSQGLWSASQNRSFVQPGSPDADSNNHNVKFVIAGKGGANVADPNGTYSNKRKQQLFNHENKTAMSRLFKKPEPGQAEILYGPNTNFKVSKIQNVSPNETHVLLTVDDKNEPGKQVKDAYSGAVISGTSRAEDEPGPSVNKPSAT
jgi:hypothetical protein